VIKRCGLIVKRDDVPLDEFRRHWLEHHTSLVRHADGLIRYRVNIIDRIRFPDSPIDGFSELWFATEEQMNAALGRASAVKEDETWFAASVTVVIVEEHAVVG
jgi:uncharacterized protein (TIGR02118 family)